MSRQSRIYKQVELVCTKHRTRGDVWYDCERCLGEAGVWAEANGFNQCISPYLAPREGSDNGAWVTANTGRWVFE